MSIFLVNTTIAQKVSSIHLSDSIATDPSLKKGVLQNGFTYYLIKGNDPSDKISIRFWVKAGEAQEEKDQIEIAHLLEHLALKSTQNFPELRGYLMSRKLTWGKDINGTTNATYTSYKIDIPVADTSLLSSCLLIVKDWANNGIDTSPEKIDNERGTVLQESALNNSVSRKARCEYIKKVLGFSENHRMCIDIEKNVRNFKLESLHRFYKDWYAPDNVALAIEGDINVDALEKQIINLYSDIEGTVKKINKKTVSAFSINQDNRYIGLSIEGYGKTECKVYFKVPYKPIHTYGDARSEFQRQLLSSIMYFRLYDAKKEHHINSSAYFTYEKKITGYQPWVSSFTMTAGNIDSVRHGLRAIMYEVFRLKKYGVNQWELDSARQKMLSWVDEEVKKPRSIEEYQPDFFEGVPVPNAQHQAAYSRQLLKSISLVDMNSFVKNWSVNNNRDIVIITPEEKKQLLPGEEMINEWVMQAANDKMIPFVYKKAKGEKSEYFPPLMTDQQLTKLEKIISKGLQQKEIRSIGATSFKLPNGIRVIVKPVQDSSQRIYIDAVNTETDCLKYSDDSVSVRYLAEILSNTSRVRTIGAKQWNSYKRQEGIVFSGGIQDNYFKLQGQAPLQKFETLLQSIHLFIVDPKVDTVSLTEWKMSKIADVNRQTEESSPYKLAENNLFNTANPVSKSLINSIERMNAGRIENLYKKIFKSNGNPIFTISGDFDINKIMPLITKYLGTLPLSTTTHARIDNTKMKPVYKRVSMEASEGKSQSSFVSISFPGNPHYERHHSVFAKVIESQCFKLMLARLRTSEGISYAPLCSVWPSDKYSDVRYVIGFHADCSRERANDAVKYLQEELKKLQEDSVQSRLLEEAKELVLDNFNKTPKDAKFWCNYLSETIGKKGDIEDITRYEEIIRSITPKEMAKFASSFDINNYSLFLLHPKLSSENFENTLHPNLIGDSTKLVSEINKQSKSGNYAAMIKAYCELYERFGSKESASDLNSAAWKVFSYSIDTNELDKAIEWAKFAVKKAKTYDRPKYLDTYAQLLYKKGFRADAVSVQLEAIENVVAWRVADFAATYYKMVTGHPTWKFPKVDSVSKRTKVYWNKLKPVLAGKFTAFQQDSIVALSKVLYAKEVDKKRYPRFLINYVERFINKNDHTSLNGYAFKIFLSSEDKKHLKNALSWSKATLKEKALAAYQDTYANLLYKLGRKEEAIAAMQKAVDAAPEKEKQTYQETLEKIKSGKPTWEN